MRATRWTERYRPAQQVIRNTLPEGNVIEQATVVISRHGHFQQ
ncbi:Unknown protein sequence [Pseudomonas syringae pv. maculicola]|uniref:Uncharacterized protein n=1 Tax=Pseudomonas syringae pv. maculicola TaxID=59511 RepID=A0A3M6BLR2_PSEYM|nr:Unknown protein sequence [Pseudomonas syringae pv. maculicola]KPC10392.1 Unknown protein sequence [Pseudomonas amygdali pv. lachrymans]RMM08397.1 hypothetical protein ALQ85_102072 [Pseudomonas syringae]RMV32515.1 hypothetical protein ALP13_103036 [Pseudomonas syringae pv. maculicola]